MIEWLISFFQQVGMKKLLLFGVSTHQNVRHGSQNDLGLSVFPNWNWNWNCQIPTEPKYTFDYHLEKELIYTLIYIYI